ncbi:MAG TPA: alpha/beta hydrolase [Intrasporangium sp.]|uniref:alpha/beta hydrolase n=1 Tax=Intrasporangium sp. TaxID=1925024 RepID=UPI002D7693C7|nr:alpha/beta hydrolase [Intrasporangium sp.]HET7399437.1 alpha/beta hydrolase [Intrasporangium sp.]
MRGTQPLQPLQPLPPFQRRWRSGTALAAVLAVVLLAAGCTSPDPVPLPAASAGAVTSPPGLGLARYYAQRLAWSRCGGGAECSTLTVPLDYEHPASGDIGIKVLRVPAGDQRRRVGSLLVNPGGPGGSGTAYARSADRIVGAPVRAYFDVVGFDPRGVGGSAPVDCLSDPELDRFLSVDPTPDDAGEEQQLLEAGTALAAGCSARSGRLLPHVSTTDAARDMDVLRAALGDARLSYLGKSYGTFLGATYADLFPQRVGRVVLDGALPPDLTSEELAEGQARGFELATRAYLQRCVDDGDCPAGDSVDAGAQWLRSLLHRVDAAPLPSGDPAVPRLGEAWASYGVAQALYDRGSWSVLTQALRAAAAGDGRPLMQLGDAYARRTPGGRYTSTIMESMYAVNCLDRPDAPDLATYRARAQRFAAVAPTWGGLLAWGSVPCGHWPARGGTPPHRVAAAGSAPIVVLGTTRDPATIYEWSTRLRDQLDNAVLVTFDGDGHTAYRRASSCVDDAIDTYYVSGQTPEDGLTC